MLHGAFVIKAIGEGKVLGVVGDCHILVTAIARGFGHFLNRIATIGFDGVHVHITLQVRLHEQSGQRVLFRTLNLPGVFSQLRRNVIKV